MKNGKEKFKIEFKKRIYLWTLRLIKDIDDLDHKTSTKIIAKQVLRSATSVGANYIEAQAASSKKDFINYLHHSLKSANESKFWLAILKDLNKVKADKLIQELIELANILGSSLLTAKGRK